MKKIIYLLALLTVAVTNVRAATNFVILGDDFQSKIDAAAPGDTLVVQAGVYPGNLHFNKALTVLRSGTNQIQFLGPVQITGAGNSSFQFSQFSSPVTIQATGTVSFARSQFLDALYSQGANVLMSQVTSSNYIQATLTLGSGTNFQAYDSSLWQLEFIGGKTLLKRCSINKVGFTTLTLSSNAAFEGLRLTNNGVCEAVASIGLGIPFVATQCSFPYPLNLTGYKVWIGYSSMPGLGASIQTTNCDSVLIGNVLNQSQVFCTGGSVKAFNNFFDSYQSAGGTLVALWLNSSDGEIVNNTLRGVIQSAGNAIDYYGLRFTAGGSSVVRANIMQVSDISVSGARNGYPIHNVGSSVIVSYCDIALAGPGAKTAQGVAPINSLFVDPLIVGAGNLNVGSPCIDAGPPDAIFNDRDGTRNNMGYTGGPFWNPANYTNDNPMVFFLTGSPQTVLKGFQTNITVNAAASAGH